MFKIFSHITLSVLILASTTGFTLNMHFCHDNLIDIAVNHQADSCCDLPQEKSDCNGEPEMEKSNHCENRSLVAAITSEISVPSFTFDFEDFHYTTLDVLPAIPLEAPVITSLTIKRSREWKKPPPQSVDLSLIQTFLV